VNCDFNFYIKKFQVIITFSQLRKGSCASARSTIIPTVTLTNPQTAPSLDRTYLDAVQIWADV
jgi:hypothetical protein